MRKVIFVKDKFNKHSLRALMAAFEVWFPERAYLVISPDDILAKDLTNELLLISFASRRAEFYMSLALSLRAKFSDVNLACGGAHPTAKPDEVIEFFDAVITNEGEITLKHVVEVADDSKVEGIIKGERVENLDDFHVFPRKTVSLGPIEIIRGCPSACAYCQTPQMFRGKLRYRSIDNIINEIKFAANRKRFVDARFIAPDASSYMYRGGVNLAAIEELMAKVKETVGLEGKLFFGTFPSELDPSGVSIELVNLLTKYCDNKLIVLGLQTASKRMQRLMTRRSGIDETENAISLLLEKKFEIVVDLIFGLPFEDDESYRETYNFIERHKGNITIHAHPYDSLPGSRWADELPTETPDYILKQLDSLTGIGKIFY